MAASVAERACFFGYGSLVNRQTHDYPNARPALLSGWRRVWVHTGDRPVAFLSVEPAPDHCIAGLVAEVPGGDWAALDLREKAYTRHVVLTKVTETDSGDEKSGLSVECAAQVYAVARAKGILPPPRHPILLSYVDTVVQGFLREFGPDGVTAFFATTTGWAAPILNDRTAPRYPRALPLSRDETALVDDNLRLLGALPVASAP